MNYFLLLASSERTPTHCFTISIKVYNNVVYYDKQCHDSDDRIS